MSSDLPEFYFRIRENGAVVFRVDTENRQRRIDLDEIATVNIKNGQIKPHGERALSADETRTIKDWMAARQSLLAARDMDDLHRAIDYLNITTQWIQSKASDEQLEEVTDALLLAMHDLRSMLVKRKADRLSKGQTSEDDA
jgi:hypothetical protein